MAEESLTEIAEQVRARVEQEASADPKPPKEKKLSSSFIRTCLDMEELGLGTLYAAVLQGLFTYSAGDEFWFVWKDHSWVKDLLEEHLSATEMVVEVLLGELSKIGEQRAMAIQKKDHAHAERLDLLQSKLVKKIGKLRTDKGRNVAVKFARTCNDPLAIAGDEFDSKPYLLACKNGVVDLRTGKLRPGRPEDFITKCVPHDFPGLSSDQSRIPVWSMFLEAVFKEDPERISFLQRLLGYALLGTNKKHVFAVLEGQGRNGKTSLIEGIRHVVGPLAAPVPSELLLDQGRARSSTSPTPDIAALRGLRFAFASETDEGRSFSPSRVKWLSGGDTLTARKPFQAEPEYFSQTHVLFLNTNHLPHISASDYAFWRRILCIPFEVSFVDEPTEPNERKAIEGLVDQIKTEASGILAWLVEGSMMVQDQGLNPPQVIREAGKSYQRREDYLADWIEASCITNKSVFPGPASDLYDNFRDWYERSISKRNVPKQKKFGTLLGKKFKRVSISGGRMAYEGINLK